VEEFGFKPSLTENFRVTLLFGLTSNKCGHMHLGIAISDFFSNPGILGLKNANPGIESWD